ncbi:O-antigen ligase family protein [Staphylospora marina]|uniref:O-antigen ligase family protein n=1 Tax=Staphylospora marina TaxID=2490858 RepID=UPI0013DE4F9B|nr:O-antigen ligase family protein [Staphylospora marina]
MSDDRRSWVNRLTRLLYWSILLSPFLPPVALAAVGAATVATHRGKWPFFSWPEKIWVGFMLLSLVSWAFNPSWFWWIPIGIIPGVMFALYYLLSVWMRETVRWTWQEVQDMYLRFWLGGFYVAFIVIIQQIDWAPLNETLLGPLLDVYDKFRWQAENSVRSVGTSGNSNLAAALLICFALMSIHALSVLPKRWQKAGAFLGFLVFCAAIWCTGSRGAWVGLVIGLIVQIWMTGHRVRTVVITLGILIAVSLFPEIIPRKDTLASTIQARVEVWSTALEIFREHWLLGTLPLHFGQIFAKKAGFYVYHAHNIFLGIATEYGIIGLLLFLTLIVETIRRARRWRKAANAREEKRLAGMLLSQTIALLGHGMYDYPIIAPQVGLLFMLSVIMIHTQYERRILQRPQWSDDSHHPPDSRTYSRTASSMLLLLWGQLRQEWQKRTG